MTDPSLPTIIDGHHAASRRAIHVSFIIDHDPLFAYMGWNLAHSLVLRAAFRWSDIHVQFTPEVGEHTVDIFRKLGCATHRMARFGDGKYCNKLGQWENLQDIEADQFVFLDTDMICVSQIAELLPSNLIAGKVVDLANPDLGLLNVLFDQFGFNDRPETVSVDASDARTYRANCNGGFYSVPKQFAETLFDAWRSYATLLLADLDHLRRVGKEAHVDQIAFCMAIHRTGLPFGHLPSNLNYYIHFPGEHAWKDQDRPLAVLHYHNDSVNADGLLEPAGAHNEDEQTAVHDANGLTTECFNTQLFWEMRHHRFPESCPGFRPDESNIDERQLHRPERVQHEDELKKNSIPGVEAWQSLAKGEHGRWFDRVKHFDDRLVRVHHRPKFALSPDDRFFCMGSCFARNVEEHLIYQGIEILSKRVVCPAEEYAGRPNAFVNKFSTHSMANELDWVLDTPDFDSSFFTESDTGWHDLQLSPGTRPVTLERALERRRYLTAKYFSRIRDATVIVLTLGLNEVWHDAATDRYLNATPSFFAVRRDPERYSVHITDVPTNIRQLEKIFANVSSINPDARLIVTVSPVPMTDTFSGSDVLVANLRSKSTLRVAAETFALSHSAIDYFPSYDMVAMSPRHRAYESDGIHVENDVVGGIMQEFIRLYMGLERTPPMFNESAYCVANPDVEAAVRRGEFSSGFEHWERHGKHEGRQLAPESGPFAFPWLQEAKI